MSQEGKLEWLRTLLSGTGKTKTAESKLPDTGFSPGPLPDPEDLYREVVLKAQRDHEDMLLRNRIKAQIEKERGMAGNFKSMADVLKLTYPGIYPDKILDPRDHPMVKVPVPPGLGGSYTGRLLPTHYRPSTYTTTTTSSTNAAPEIYYSTPELVPIEAGAEPDETWTFGSDPEIPTAPSFPTVTIPAREWYSKGSEKDRLDLIRRLIDRDLLKINEGDRITISRVHDEVTVEIETDDSPRKMKETKGSVVRSDDPEHLQEPKLAKSNR